MSKSTLLFSIFFLSLSVKTMAQQNLDKINWPPQYEPAKSKFYVHNEIDINASPQAVWDILIDALKWESYYKGAKNVVFLNPNDKTLQANSVFNWQTMGLKSESTIKDALQVLPFLAFYVLKDVKATLFASLLYGFLAIFTLVQALQGKPFFKN